MEECNQTTFVAVYRGRTVSDSQILAISAAPFVVERFSDLLPEGALEGPRRRPDLRLVEEPPNDAA
jgi:hypothetical protein